MEDKTQELERQVELTKMAERRAEELESRQRTMQSQVEISLTQSNEKMSEIIQKSRSLEGERQLLVERSEKLKLA